MKVRLVKQQNAGQDVYNVEGMPKEKTKWQHATVVRMYGLCANWDVKVLRVNFLRWAKKQGHDVRSVLGNGVAR